MTNIILGFVIIHVICDFYCQTEKTAAKKRAYFKWVVYHAVVYGITALLFFIIFLPGLEVKYAAAFILSHGLIDMLKYFCGYWVKNDKVVFCVDQCLHFLTIAAIVYYIRNLDIDSLIRIELQAFLEVFGISLGMSAAWTAKLLLLHKPVNILIAYILEGYKPPKEESTDKKAGRYIGTLERMLIAVFIYLNQYSAIGLVLTAKSIARYDRIANEPDFAEYYLLGTLLSTISAVCISVIV